MSDVLQVVGLVLVGSVVLSVVLAALMAVNGRTDRRVLLAGALADDVSSATPASLGVLSALGPATVASEAGPFAATGAQGLLTDSPS